MKISIEKHWDGNETETEGSNGRVYVSRGRWQWVVIVDGEAESAHDRKRDAVHHINQLASRTAVNGEATTGGFPDDVIICDRCRRSFLRKHHICICRG